MSTAASLCGWVFVLEILVGGPAALLALRLRLSREPVRVLLVRTDLRIVGAQRAGVPAVVATWFVSDVSLMYCVLSHAGLVSFDDDGGMRVRRSEQLRGLHALRAHARRGGNGGVRRDEVQLPALLV